jgi:hypothetical protein
MAVSLLLTKSSRSVEDPFKSSNDAFILFPSLVQLKIPWYCTPWNENFIASRKRFSRPRRDQFE